jgi:mRNA-degrading endonuclease RelE of RelBE toxin-antitoxin system
MVAASAKHIDFSPHAYFAFHTLPVGEQKKAMKLVESSSNDNKNLLLEGESYKLKNFDRNIYALKLTDKLRIIVEITDDEVKILDILNRDLYDVYFNKKQ